MKRLIAVVAAALSLTACTPTPNSGEVVGKDYYSETTVMMPMYTTMCSGSPPVCTQVMTGMIPITTPEHWTLHLKNGDDTGDHDVSEAEYEEYQVGQRFPKEEKQR